MRYLDMLREREDEQPKFLDAPTGLPSKPSKPSFEGFEGTPLGTSGNSRPGFEGFEGTPLDTSGNFTGDARPTDHAEPNETTAHERAESVNDTPRLAWLITHPDGRVVSATFTPWATRAEVEEWYPGATIEPDLDTAQGLTIPRSNAA